MKTTTLNKIKSFNPCTDGWEKLLKSLGKTEADDEPLLMSTILKSNGLFDAVWCLRAFHVDHRQSVIDFACDCAESVLPIWEEWAKVNALENLETLRQAITMARNSSCADAARAAANAAYAAANAAYAARAADDDDDDAAAYAANAAARAARADDAADDDADADAAARAARAAARAADAAYAADAVRAAGDVAYAAIAARAAAAGDAAEKVIQEKLLIKHFG
jgi:hypothetical protein